MNHSPQEPAAPESRKQTVLVVDDNPANLDTVTDYLAEYGFEVLIAQNGKVGLERAQSVHPDMILLDVLMPGMDGFEVCQCLKADAATRNIPVIFMTALAETEHKIRGFQLGAVDYVTKPMQREEVLARVLTHLRLRELNERLEQQVRERTDELVSANQQLQQEIAERRQVETALRESEENYRTLVEQAKDGIAIVQDASVQYVNQYLLEMGGYAAEEVIGSSFDMYVHPDEIARAADRYRRRMAGEPISQIYESALRYKDGRKVEVEINANRITYRGRPADLVIIRDITERKQAETERTQLLMQIQEQAQRVQQIVDTVPEGVLLLDAEGHIVLANPTAAGDLLALASAQVGDILTHLGNRPLDELLTSPPKGLWHELAANGQIFQVIARSLETGPTPGGWVLVIRDVTQQRELDRRVRQRERLAAVGQLAAGIAHDFNNIMATIILYAQMTARSEELPADIRERMATIDQQARHATNLIRQILDFSRRSAIKRQPLDLLPFLKEQVQLLERTLPESIRIELAYEPGEYIVVADLTSMQQMMTNLALNARDAMPQGGACASGWSVYGLREVGRPPCPR
jgi:PAS domain S-box-containing protein